MKCFGLSKSSCDNWYLIMQYAANGSIENFYKQNGVGISSTEKDKYGLPMPTGLDWSSRLEFIWQLAIAMKHMHDKNIYHRKLEPSNIMLTEDGMVLVGDLGATTDADR